MNSPTLVLPSRLRLVRVMPRLLSCSLLVCVALAMSLSLLLLGASGQPRVEWVGAENCPGAEQELELAVDDYVGEAGLGGNVSASLRLVDAGGSGLWLTLTVESDAGREQHELRALSCEQIVEEAGLLLAGVIDPFVYAGGGRRMQRESVPIQRPLAVVVIGGLVSSTGLTLIVLPALYGWFATKTSADHAEEAAHEDGQAHGLVPASAHRVEQT